MSVSPDLDAWMCYLLVLLLGMWTGVIQVRKRLRNLEGKWVMVNTWALLFAYTAVPVALFWLLDRTGAIHDTSLFAAVLIGVGYQQILTGASGTIRAPGDVSAFWKPFATWSDAIALRITDRVALNSQRFDERLLSRISSNPAKFQDLLAVVLVHCPDPQKMDQDLKALEANEAVIGTAGVQRKKAELLYQAIKVYSPQQFEYLLFKNKITGLPQYLWYAKEWRSKVVTVVVGIVLASFAGTFAWELRNPQYRASYYIWRLVKQANTDNDRFRARTMLTVCLEQSPGAYGELIARLRNPNIPVKTADDILSLVLELKDSAAQHKVDLRDELADAMRTDNSDVRERIQKVLVYLSSRDGLSVPDELKAWHSDPKNSASDIDERVSEWHSVKPGSAAAQVSRAVLKSSVPDPHLGQLPLH
jgi:hypothetical protein